MTTLYASTATPMTLTSPSQTRLIRVELRKAVDTRAGRWLLVLIAVIIVATAVINGVTGHASSHTLAHILGETGQLTADLLPVLGVLLVTSEWSQHSALTTFTLVPRRSRVMGAKAAAAVTLAVTVAVGCAVAAAVVTAAVGHGASAGAGVWAGAGGAIGGAVAFQILNVLLGVGFGLLFRSSAVAIVVYFVVPTAWSVLTGTITALHGVGHWLDPSTAWNHLAGGTVTATTWAQIALAAAVWIGLPMAAGLWQLTHRPVG
jgi:ABC-2 type transport system permease protein